jgi:oligoendopeptidase F
MRQVIPCIVSVYQEPGLCGSSVYHICAEVASTLNEALLSSYLLDYYRGYPAMKAYILNREIDNFRQHSTDRPFCRVEKVCHAILEQNLPLTLDVIKGEIQETAQCIFWCYTCN